MARDPQMVCTCCGTWRIVLVKISSGERHRPHQLLRILNHGLVVREVTKVADVEDVLRTFGMDIANFVEEKAHA